MGPFGGGHTLIAIDGGVAIVAAPCEGQMLFAYGGGIALNVVDHGETGTQVSLVVRGGA